MDAVEFLKAFHPQGPWLLVAISLNGAGLEADTFGPATADAARRWIAAFNGKRNLYFSVNDPGKSAKRKTKRRDIKRVCWLHVDVDARAGEPLAAELERIKALLTDHCPVPPPTFVVFSGGGYQAFWRLRKPLAINGDLAAAERAARYNKQLELVLGGDNCHNIDRIMRLPGTTNLPNERKAAQGRQREIAEVHLYEPDRVYDLAQFTPAPTAQPQTTVPVPVGPVQRISASMAELDTYNVPARVRTVIVQGHDPDTPKEGDNSRSAWLFDCVCQLVRAEVPDELIYGIITDPDLRISASVLDKGRRATEYATRQIQRAKDEAEEPWLRRLNDQFCIVANYGGRCVVVEENTRPGEVSYLVQKRDDFCARHAHVHVQEGKRTYPLGKWWLAHPKARRYEGVDFAPGGDVANDVLNMWRGFPYESALGDWSLLHDHILQNVAGEHANWLLNWMARAVQHPGAPAEVAVVLRGGRGVGKGFFAREFGALFVPHFRAISNPRHLVGNFNSHLEDCVLLLVDEAYYAGDKRHESVLKALVTEPTLAIERKGYDLRQTRNNLHMIMCSNEAWVVPAGLDERRFLVLHVAATRQRDTEYFGRIAAQMRSGGREAMLHDLLHRDLAGWDFRQAPDTATLTDQKLLTLDPVRRRVYEALCTGSHAAQCRADGARVFVVTKTWAKELDVTVQRLGRELQAFADVQDRVALLDGEKRSRGFWLPPLPEARRRWAAAHGLSVRWPQDVLEWDGAEECGPDAF